MKKLFLSFAAIAVILTGCSNDSGNDEKDTTEEDTAGQEEVTVSNFTMTNFYQTLFPFEVSAGRSANSNITDSMTSRLDVDNFEMGLVRLAQDEFPTEDYIFQEGQFLDNTTLTNWRRRATENNPDGLNPALPDSGTTTERHEASPLYLANISEHNYLVEDSDGNYVLGGVVIGLAMNSVHNFNLSDEDGGFPRTVNISDSRLLEKGEEMAGEVLKRLRQMEGLEDVPISFMIYKQETSGSLVPGNFVARTDVGRGSNMINNWEKLNEVTYLFPSSAAESNVTDISTLFGTFTSKIGEYFPDYIGVIGRGFYQNGQIQVMNIEIPMTFHSETEVVGFTQYVASLVTQYFPSYIEVNVYISSTTQQESLIVREAHAAEPIVHIYR